MKKSLQLLTALIMSSTLIHGAETPLTTVHPPLLVASYDKKAAFILSSDDKVIWKTDLPGVCQDAWLLETGNVLSAGGNVVKVVRPDHSEVWKWTAPAGQPVEIHNCQPLPGGGAVFGVGGLAQIIEVNGTGNQTQAIQLPLKGSAHEQMRQVRKLSNGNYLVCAKGENNVYEFDSQAHPVRLVAGEEMKKKGVIWKALHSADLLPNGNLLVGGGYDSSLAEIDPAGKVVWNLTNADVPGFTYAAGSQRLADGTTVVAAYHSWVPIFAVSPEKKIVWVSQNKEIGHATHVKVLSQKQVDDFIKAVTPGN